MIVCPWTPAAAEPAPDVGLVTEVAGQVGYVGAEEGSRPGRVQAFMKIRAGDRLTLPAGALVRLVFFANGRRELWQGAATLKVGERGAQGVDGQGRPLTPVVDAVPTHFN